jgi:hypothetical protein
MTKPVPASTLCRILNLCALVLAAFLLNTAAVSQRPLYGQPQPPLERNPFREAYTTREPSIARADLLACRELATAKNAAPRDLDLKQFAQALTGTWVRQLTWNGVVVDNNSALFFDFRGNEPQAMMYDQSNMGGGPMFKKVQEIRNNPTLLAKSPRLTFVDCDFLIVDTYYKVSNDFLFDGLPTKVTAAEKAVNGKPLAMAWTQLISNKFFRVEKQESQMAVEPGAEMLTPSVGGAFWKAKLEPAQVGGFKGANLKLDGEYQGAHVNEEGIGKSARFAGAADINFKGGENAQFFMVGNKFVSSARSLGTRSLAAGELASGWTTDCAEFFNLPQAVVWERVVLDPGVQ